MKKIMLFILCFSLCCMSFTGCDNEQAETSKTITRYTTEGKVTKLVGDETLSGNLRIGFLGSYTQEELDRAQKMYNELYPNVSLTIDSVLKNSNNDQLTEMFAKLQTEIMSGKGPDVFTAGGSFNNCYKTAKAGACADLTEYFENDKNFNASDFCENVLYAGQLDGKQYLVPPNFNIPFVLTTQAIVEESGFKLDKCKDLISTEEEMLRVLKENKFGCDPSIAAGGLTTPYWFLNQAHETWIDYDAQKVHLADDKRIEKVFNLCKEYVPYYYMIGSSVAVSGIGRLIPSAPVALLKKQIMFSQMHIDSSGHYIQVLRELNALKSDNPKDKELIFFNIPNMDGKIQGSSLEALAVSSNSKNVPAAYAFIKLLLSNEFNIPVEREDGTLAFPLDTLGFPLNKTVYRNYILKLGTRGDKAYAGDGEFVDLADITQEEVDLLLKNVYSVDCATFETNVVYDIMEQMQPYVFENVSYEECIQKAQEYLEIYVSE